MNLAFSTNRLTGDAICMCMYIFVCTVTRFFDAPARLHESYASNDLFIYRLIYL